MHFVRADASVGLEVCHVIMMRSSYTREAEFPMSKSEFQLGTSEEPRRPPRILDHGQQLGRDVIPSVRAANDAPFTSEVGAGNDVTHDLTEVWVGDVHPTFRVVRRRNVRLGSRKFRLPSTTLLHHRCT